ncbi:MAG: NUDIX hydrolase [Candidatus Aenigmarchaeota archaeon]|nr:NUDIX hydrolase [Candidatus Aenigmarchaeota archaeon]
MKQKIASYGAIIENGKVLLLHRIKPDVWEFPGGRIEYAEDPADTARREVEEETDLKVEVLGMLDVGSIVRPDGMHEIVLVYKCKRIEGEVGLSPEHSEYRWVSFDDLKSIKNLATSVISVMDKLKEELE